MNQELWQRAEELFHAALDQPPEARRAFLDAACGQDVELRRLVETLVSNNARAGNFLDEPALAEVRGSQAARGSLVGRHCGPYRIVSFLGGGGMGEVYRAHDSKLGRDVAIKTMPPEFARDPDRLARFRREARALASLNHPNIAAIYGLEESAGTDYLVLELVEGDTLQGPLPMSTALDLAAQVAEALEAAHQRGIVHRDLKPANLHKVTPQGRLKVLAPSGGWIPAVIAGRTGVGMSQRAQSFVLDPAEGPFNVIEPGKRPRATLTPGLALKDGQPYLAFAVQGGDSQDQNLLQFFLNVVEFGMNVQQALEASSIVTTSFKSSYYPHAAEGKLQVPASLPRHVLDELAAMGHTLDVRSVRGVGSVKAILIHPATGVLMGGVSPTRDSYVMAY